jgi:hypothetical protein
MTGTMTAAVEIRPDALTRWWSRFWAIASFSAADCGPAGFAVAAGRGRAAAIAGFFVPDGRELRDRNSNTKDLIAGPKTRIDCRIMSLTNPYPRKAATAAAAPRAVNTADMFDA